MAEPDQDHEIEQWTSTLGVPEWVDKKAYKKCKKCEVSFSKGHQHHCRGCGEMFCSDCTSKFHIPEHLIGKDKKGPTRVCFTCRDKCLMEREKSQGDVLTDRRLNLQYTIDLDSGRKFIHPPLNFVHLTINDKCGICGTKGNKLYHCATCGDAVCSECLLSDVELPKAFKTPKGNSSKLCKQCRFYHYDGASFVITPPRPNPDWAGIRSVAPKGSDGLALHSSLTSGHASGYDSDEKNHDLAVSMRQSTQLLQDAAMLHGVRKSSSKAGAARKKGYIGSTLPSALDHGRRFSEIRAMQSFSGSGNSGRIIRPSISFKAIEADFSAMQPTSPKQGERSVAEKESSPSKPKVERFNSAGPGVPASVSQKQISTVPISIRWEGQTKDIAILEVKDGDNLQLLFNKLKSISPEISKGKFSFAYNGVPIRSEHWKLVEAKKLFPVVFLKEGTYDYLRRVQPEQLGFVIFDFDAENSSMLSLRRDQNILLVKADLSSKWWFGYSADRSQYGWFPQDRVKIVDQ